MLRLREWAAQIDECQKSGLTVKQWCDKKGINRKTYYNRVRVVRGEVLELAEASGTNWLSGEILKETGIMTSGQQLRGSTYKKLLSAQQTEKPEFAELTVPPIKSGAVTVRFGEYAIDIQNNADDTIVEHILRVVARL